MTLTSQTGLVDPTTAGETLVDASLDALLHHAGIAPLDTTGWLRVTGEDRVRWLNGMVTNSIQDLTPGDGCFNFILSAQGRIQGTVTAFALPDSILLETDRSQIATLMATLDRFIIMDDVELTDISNEQAGVSVIGPEAAMLLTRIGVAAPDATSLSRHEFAWKGNNVTVITAHSPLVPRYELWADTPTTAALTDALTETGALACTPEAMDHLRILEGTPRFGTDIRDKELPQETNQPRALHFAKGCYLGQEIVERIRSRGSVHRTFTGFRLKGALPAPGSAIEADGKPVGELTSVAAIPLASGTSQFALGYIRREALERSATLTYPGGIAVASSLPFQNL